jgi:hypothetical protein
MNASQASTCVVGNEAELMLRRFGVCEIHRL